MKKSTANRICILMSVCFFLSLIPLLLLGTYAHPIGDDYSYGLAAHQAWKSSHSLFVVIKAALQNTRSFYNSWQGTFSSIFLMSLQPAVISERLYPLTTWMMLGSLIGSHLFFFHILFTRYFKTEPAYRLITALTVLFLSIQQLDTPGEAFFWYNGAVHYVFMHSCMLLTITLLLLFLKTNRRPLSALLLCLASLLAFLCGGANYVTMLLTPVLLSAALLLCLLFKEKRGLWLILPLLTSFAGLLLNVMAPGTRNRMAVQSASLSAPKAIYASFLSAVEQIGTWTTLYVLLALLLLTPIFIHIASEQSFSFPLPGLILTASFCIFAASFTPSLYSMGYTGIFGRTLNIMMMLFYLLLILNYFYLLGWLVQICRKLDQDSLLPALAERLKEFYGHTFCTSLAVFLLILLLCTDKNSLTSSSAAHSLYKGYAQSYHTETLNRIALLSMEGVDEVWIPNYSVQPPLFSSLEDISEDSGNWRNMALAHWYGKQKVNLSVIY